MSKSPNKEKPRITLESIDTGVALVEAKNQLDSEDVLEGKDPEVVAAHLRNKLARSKIKNVKADRKMRKAYASRILLYLESYSAGVACLILLNGFHVFGFSLDKGVLTTLVGSTAVAAIGLVGFIARGLFKPPTTAGE